MKKLWSLIGGVLLCAAFVIFSWQAPPIGDVSDGQLHVAFLDVGQGDSAVIVTPSSTVYMVDVGPPGSLMKPLGKVVKAGTPIEGLFLTHPHSDHLGNVALLLERNPVKKVFYTGVPHTTPTYFKAFEAIKHKNISMQLVAGPQTFTTPDGVTFEILYPTKDMRDTQNWIVGGDELNDTSIVLRVIYKEKSFLFMGDASSEVEKLLVENKKINNVSVLKLGHHGSKTASSLLFLQTTAPEYAILSVGKDNEYGHPHPDVMMRLGQLNTPYARTDLHGTIHIRSDGHILRFNTDREYNTRSDRY